MFHTRIRLLFFGLPNRCFRLQPTKNRHRLRNTGLQTLVPGVDSGVEHIVQDSLLVQVKPKVSIVKLTVSHNIFPPSQFSLILFLAAVYVEL